MRRSSPLARRTPLKRTALKSKPNPTGPPPDVVDAVYGRAGHSCEICGVAVGPRRGQDHHIHHRRPRGSGGSSRPETNLPPNLLLVCPPCHGDLESHRAVALSMGWLVPQNCDPAHVAVLLRRDRWRYLALDGRYSVYPPARSAP